MNISPLVAWNDVPANTRSFVLSIVDHHPFANEFVHWGVINIPANIREIPERASGIREKMPPGSQELRNGYGNTGYGGPYLAPGAGLHEYAVSVLALGEESLEFGPLALLGDVMTLIGDGILSMATVSARLQI